MDIGRIKSTLVYFLIWLAITAAFGLVFGFAYSLIWNQVR